MNAIVFGRMAAFVLGCAGMLGMALTAEPEPPRLVSTRIVRFVDVVVEDTPPARISHASRTPAIVPVPAGETLLQCLNRGSEARLTRAELADLASVRSWPGQTTEAMAETFWRESGGCVSVISETDDHGCTQIHRYPEREARWDYARIRTDCGYAMDVSETVYREHGRLGVQAGTAFVAGEGVLWPSSTGGD